MRSFLKASYRKYRTKEPAQLKKIDHVLTRYEAKKAALAELMDTISKRSPDYHNLLDKKINLSNTDTPQYVLLRDIIEQQVLDHAVLTKELKAMIEREQLKNKKNQKHIPALIKIMNKSIKRDRKFRLWKRFVAFVNSKGEESLNKKKKPD